MYDSIQALPLHKFIGCLCDGNLRHLVVRGCATETDLQSAWERVLDEYLSFLSDSKDKYAMNLTRDIYLLEYNIHRIALIQKYLFFRNDPEIAQQLIDSGIVLQPYPKENNEARARWLTMVSASIKRMIASLETKRAELRRIQPDFSSQKADRKYFNDMLTTLSKYAGYHIDEYHTMTGRYVSILLQYREYCKDLEKQLNKK